MLQTSVENLYDLIASKQNADKQSTETFVDVTVLKHMMHHCKIHMINPVLFKAVNDAASKGNF